MSNNEKQVPFLNVLLAQTKCTICVINNMFILPSEYKGPSWPWSYDSWIYNYLCNRCLWPLMLWVRLPLWARCTTLCDKVGQWLKAGLWFSLGPPVSSTNKIYHHNITEILLKVALNTIKPQPTFWISMINHS